MKPWVIYRNMYFIVFLSYILRFHLDYSQNIGTKRVIRIFIKCQKMISQLFCQIKSKCLLIEIYFLINEADQGSMKLRAFEGPLELKSLHSAYCWGSCFCDFSNKWGKGMKSIYYIVLTGIFEGYNGSYKGGLVRRKRGAEKHSSPAEGA